MTRGTRIAYKMFSLREHPVSTTGIVADIILLIALLLCDRYTDHTYYEVVGVR